MGIRLFLSQISTFDFSASPDSVRPEGRQARSRHPAIQRAAMETLESRTLFAVNAGSFTALPNPLTTSTSNPEAITIAYTDAVNIDHTSIDATNITVSGPGMSGGPLLVSIGVSSSPMDAMTLTGGYAVDPPSGTWTSADNGTYTVALGTSVTDVSSGTTTANPSFGTFVVNIPAPVGPTAALTAPTSITTAGGMTKTLVVTYTDSASPVVAASILTSNITVTGPSNQPLTVQSATASPNSNGSPITATYVVQSPGGIAWSSSNNGTYRIALATTVHDVANNAVTANPSFGTFTVNIAAGPGPTAALSQPTAITTAGGTTENVIVTYTDSASPIVVASIAPTNLTVTGPGNTPLTVQSVTTTPSVNGSPITATYVVQSPGGTAWSSADNGSYNIALNATVTDVATNAVAANPSFGTFTVNIASAGPVAALTQPTSITTAGGTTENIVVTYTDSASPVVVASIVPTNITVTAPGNTPLTVLSVTTTPTVNGSPITATYVVQSSGGTAWSSSNNGTYTIALNATVTDVAANPVAANPNFGTFTVNITAPPGPVAVLTAPTPIISPVGTTKNIVVTYTDTVSPIVVASIVPTNITVTGPGNTPLTVLSVTTAPAVNGSPITATYVVQAPGGTAWSVADNGLYQIALNPIVHDVANNNVPANANFGTFTVAIDSPPTGTFTPPATIAAGQTVFDIKVVFTDADATPVKVSTIGVGNITVTGPGGPLQVLSATPTPAANGSPITVTYTVASPSALGFRPADNGTYTVALTNTVTDIVGSPVIAVPVFGTFPVSIGSTNAPIPTIKSNFDVTLNGQLSKQVVISYTDSIGIDLASINAGNINVTSTKGTPLVVINATTTATVPAPIIDVTYTIAKADTTAFTAADNGAYTINIAAPPLSVANTSGVFAAAFPGIATFLVNAPDTIPPTGTVSASDITRNGVATVIVTAVLTDNAAINTSTIHPSNLTVTDPSGRTLLVQQVIGLGQPNGPLITLQFVVAAPAGTFTKNDNGFYSVQLSGITDTSGNFMPTTFGLFQVNIPVPQPQTFSLGTFSAAASSKKLKFRDIPDGTVGILTIAAGTGEAFQDGSSNAIDLVLNDVGKGVNVKLNSSNGRPINLNKVIVNGTLVNFVAPNVNVTGTFYVNGTVQSASFRHLVGDSTTPAVFAASGPIQKLKISAATTQSVILSGANLGGTATLGAADNSFGPGTISSLVLGGVFTTSVVAAGANPGPDGKFGTADDTAAGTGPSSIDSIVASGTGLGAFFESKAFGKGPFKFSRHRIIPSPATDIRFVLLK